MSVTATCECGHVTKVDPHELPDASHSSPPRCPACGRLLAEAARPETDSTGEAPPVRRTFQQAWQSHWQADQAIEAQPLESPGQTTTAAAIPDSDSSASTLKRRSLWDVMRSAESADDTTSSAAESPPADPSPAPLKPKGLWNVMRPAEPVAATAEPATLVTPRADEAVATEVHSADADARDAVDLSLARRASDEPAPTVSASLPPRAVSNSRLMRDVGFGSTSVRSTWQDVPREWSRRAVAAVALSLVGVLLATLSIRPGWTVRLPSLVVGLIAVLLGFTAMGDLRRSRGRLKGTAAAWAGVVLGAAGMFLAPMVFANLGERWRENAGREEIVSRLKRLGQALDQHHEQLGHYPAAVEFGKVGNNAKVPLHGWMTPLLPYLGHEPLFRNIDPRQPWDAPANQGMMQQIIPQFMLPGHKPLRLPRGYGATHFAGVGGEDVREPAGLVHFGIFSETGPTKREQITDGAAQTLIVGEIHQSIPAWGEPGNFRSIGEGLNREWQGFGNPEGTGATFLHADGSVKFYSNKVDRRVLEQLSTRDGGETER